MTAQASLPTAARFKAQRPSAQRPVWAVWAAALTLAAALLGAGICITVTQPDCCPVIALVH